MITTEDRPLRVGELARATGLTVRTLHHYDDIGLLVPSQRTLAGHRLYTSDDVQRLYRIVALRQIGLSLEEVKVCLEDEGADPRPTLRRHLDELERRVELQQVLSDRLRRILGALEGRGEPTTEEFLEALEVMERMETYYTPEQLEYLEQRRKALGADAIRRGEQDWAELIAEVEAARRRGVDPAAPELAGLVRRWHALIEAFTGGNEGIRQSLQKMYETEGVEKASRGSLNADTSAYMQQAIAAHGGTNS